MTETEQKALALVNEAHTDFGLGQGSTFNRKWGGLHEALCRAIEQHEAFRQEVSDALEKRCFYIDDRDLGRFIIAKPDPLVEALNDIKDGRAGPTTESYAACLRAAIEKRGGKLTWGER